MIAIPEPEEEDKSAIWELSINSQKDDNNILMSNKTQGYDIGTNETTQVGILEKAKITSPTPKLPLMSRPILTLFLSNHLIADDGQRVPYLEYQVLTDHPVGNSKIIMKVVTGVDGNGGIRTLTQEIEKPLLDFAIQN